MVRLHAEPRVLLTCCSLTRAMDGHLIRCGYHQLIYTNHATFIQFYSFYYQRVSIASYASAGIARAEMSVCLSVCLFVRLSVTLRYCIKTKRASVMISSPSESLDILVSRNIWFITKFDRGHPERGRYLRLGWVRTGDFSTNKPPYLQNGARQDQCCY